jgi:hypothetical protein
MDEELERIWKEEVFAFSRKKIAALFGKTKVENEFLQAGITAVFTMLLGRLPQMQI